MTPSTHGNTDPKARPVYIRCPQRGCHREVCGHTAADATANLTRHMKAKNHWPPVMPTVDRLGNYAGTGWD